jgi:formylglycine-generating enzyme required for sulfatase activity
MLAPRRLSLLAVLILLALSASTPGALPTARLLRWEGPAALIRHTAPGVEYYRLVARVQWPEGLPAGAGYRLHLIHPDGRTEVRSIPENEIRARRVTALVRSAEVRDRRPADVVFWINASDAATGAVVSNDLEATILDFPRPAPAAAANDPGPFGWGEPLAATAGEPSLLPREGADGFRFVRVPATDAVPGFLIATTEATNAQVAKRLAGYDPRAGRSDEFALEDPAQPAIGLSPQRAGEYLAALGKADPSGLTYRLPTRDEWLRAARAGKESVFWWGDAPTHREGANFLGPEPALATDTTAPARPVESAGSSGFVANPWGLFHTFGNVAEWASTQGGGFVRLGGQFRTEPAVPLPEPAVESPEATGSDPYVGVRPAITLGAEDGAEHVRTALRGNGLLAGVSVAYDPDRATATLTGTLPSPALRRAADRRLEPVWFLAAVENRIETPTLPAGQLAAIGAPVAPAIRITPLGRWIYVVPLAVQWGDPLPVRGSEWWVNVYPNGAQSGCGHYAYKLAEGEPNDEGRFDLLIDRGKLTAAGVALDATVAVTLSLGAPAPVPTDPRIVSNVSTVALAHDRLP